MDPSRDSARAALARQQAWQAATRRVLELVARGDDLDDVLDALMRSAEEQFPGIVASILLLDRDGRLRSGPAPSLPESFRRSVDGLVPGPAAGSCGTAAHRRQRVIVEDVSVDPLWVDFRDQALRLGLHACWSEPILASSGPVLGTFAIYRRAVGGPSPDEIELLETAAHIARIGIERRRAETELQERAERLRQAQKMEAVGRLAGGVAHDFNNLLTAILGHAELLANGLPLSDPRSVHARGILAAADRGARLTRQLLAVSRNHVLVPKVFELNAVVEETAAMLRPLIGEHIVLVTRLDPATGLVRADVSQIEQVVINLALNARDAMPAGGTLTLSTSRTSLTEEFARHHPGARPGEHCVLAVSDDGIGMDEQTRARIFEPFFTTKASGHGTGLGLATVYGAVKDSDGSICVESEPGMGTTFRIHLPWAGTTEATERPCAAASTDPYGEETILLVEDQDDVRDVMRQALETVGYSILEARDGEEGLRFAAEHPGPIHLVVTDVVMPGTGGREMALTLGATRPGCPVLFVSGHTESAIPWVVGGEPAVEFLQKPFSPSALARTVREVLDRAGSLRP